MRNVIRVRILVTVIAAVIAVSACSSGGDGYSGSAEHGIRYGHYYGPGPWGAYPGYADVDPENGIDDGRVAVPLPEMGMPDMGSMDMGMGMDIGGFDF